MEPDPIVEELHRIRAEHAARFQYDIHAMAEDLRQSEQRSSRQPVYLSPKPTRPLEATSTPNS